MTLHPDPPAVQLDEPSRERQPESGATHLPVRRPDLAELLEDRVLILRRDPDASVADGYLHTAVGGRRPHVDPTALWRELDRVREQVQQHLLDFALVGADRVD